MKKITISRERAMQQAPISLRNQLLNEDERPNFNTQEDILNFDYYFKNWTLIEGENGPEPLNSKIYISVYHFLEYQGRDPHQYNTFKIGGHFYSECGNDYLTCRYKEFSELIHKYDFDLLLTNFHEFENFKK